MGVGVRIITLFSYLEVLVVVEGVVTKDVDVIVNYVELYSKKIMLVVVDHGVLVVVVLETVKVGVAPTRESHMNVIIIKHLNLLLLNYILWYYQIETYLWLQQT